jgi:hypothetical protein
MGSSTPAPLTLARPATAAANVRCIRDEHAFPQ